MKTDMMDSLGCDVQKLRSHISVSVRERKLWCSHYMFLGSSLRDIEAVKTDMMDGQGSGDKKLRI